VPAIGLAALLAMTHALRVFQAAISDDAFILYRYARHLAAGHGLTWNIGEPPIEGFTSMLHVWILSAGRAAGVDCILLGQLLGVGFAGMACIAAAWLGRELSGGDTRVSVSAAFLLALVPHMAAWARGGLETTTFTTLLALAVAVWLRESRHGNGRHMTCFCFFVAILSRPEALAVATAALICDAMTGGIGAMRQVRRRISAWWPFFVLLAFLAVGKVAYFGNLVPNTYHAKTGGGIVALEAGARYVFRFFRDYGSINGLLAILPFLLFPVRSKRGILFAGVTIVGYSLHVARVGGDYAYFSRYLVPLLPLLCALTTYGAVTAWDAASGLPERRRLAAATLATAGGLLQVALPSVREIADRPWLLSRPLRIVHDTDPELFRRDFELIGLALRDITGPQETVAALAVGATGYFSERPMLDLMGLNDRAFARLPIDLRGREWVAGHMRGDAKEILRRAPDLIVMPFRPTEEPNALPSDDEQRKYPFMADLLNSPEFDDRYQLESHRIEDARWVNVYRKRSGASSR
jgi:hypothetical protein